MSATQHTSPQPQHTSLEPAAPVALIRTQADRRHLLKAAGLVALVGATGSTLAACSSGTTATPAANTTPSPGAASSVTPSAAAPSSASSGSASTKAAAGPSATMAEVPVGGGFILPNADYVVTQPTKGTYKAFSKICTHQGCPVTKIVNKEIVCPCHGSHFSIADGSVVSGPAQSPLPEAKTKVSGNKIVISA